MYVSIFNCYCVKVLHHFFSMVVKSKLKLMSEAGVLIHSVNNCKINEGYYLGCVCVWWWWWLGGGAVNDTFSSIQRDM